MSTADNLGTRLRRAAGAKDPPRAPAAVDNKPVWRGPGVDGISYSLLSRFLQCRERFRVTVVDGLAPADTFNARIEYGQMWHKCEEAMAASTDGRHPSWVQSLKDYAKGLCLKYPLNREEIEHWYQLCSAQFPVYAEHWAKHPDVGGRTPLLQEYPFKVKYRLPSGRDVLLRGKWDSVDLIGKGKHAGVYLQENKTKSSIHEGQLRRQLSFDLQTMLYVVALREYPVKEYLPKGGETAPVLGVRYNVIKRPLHKRGKKETQSDFNGRVADMCRRGVNSDNKPETWFARWKVEITEEDVDRFRRECLDPILECLCDWWGYLEEWGHDPFYNGGGRGTHWCHPFGVYNILDEGGSSDLDEYLMTGSKVGLVRVETVFPELEATA